MIGNHRRPLSFAEIEWRKREMDSYLEFARLRGVSADDRRTAEHFEAHMASDHRPIEPGYSGSWHQPQHRMSAVEQWRRKS